MSLSHTCLLFWNLCHEEYIRHKVIRFAILTCSTEFMREEPSGETEFEHLSPVWSRCELKSERMLPRGRIIFETKSRRCSYQLNRFKPTMLQLNLASGVPVFKWEVNCTPPPTPDHHANKSRDRDSSPRQRRLRLDAGIIVYEVYCKFADFDKYGTEDADTPIYVFYKILDDGKAYLHAVSILYDWLLSRFLQKCKWHSMARERF